MRGAASSITWAPLAGLVHYENSGDGLMALDATKPPKGEYLRLSGDLYAFPSDHRFPSLKEIPILPRDDYRFHLRAIDVRDGPPVLRRGAGEP